MADVDGGLDEGHERVEPFLSDVFGAEIKHFFIDLIETLF